MLDVVPEGTPAEVVEHRLPEDERICSACGSEMVEIGKEVRRSLMMKPAEFWVREDVYKGDCRIAAREGPLGVRLYRASGCAKQAVVLYE